MVYTVVDPDVFTPGKAIAVSSNAWRKLSGGVAYFPKNSRDLVKDLEEIAGNIRRGYSIGYAAAVDARAQSDASREGRRALPGRKDLSVRVRSVYMESD